MARIDVKVKLDLPAGVELLGYERCGDGHGFEVKFPLPDFCRCDLWASGDTNRFRQDGRERGLVNGPFLALVFRGQQPFARD